MTTRQFTVRELASVVGGRLFGGEPDAVFRGITTDSRRVQAAEVFVALRGDRHDGATYVDQAFAAGAVAAVVSEPAGPLAQQATIGTRAVVTVPDSLAALGCWAAYYRSQMPAWVVAVTGSNGKTTTKEMIHAVLSASPGRVGIRSPRSFNNFVGVPLTLLGITERCDFAVVEVGTNAPGEVAHLAGLVSPQAAVVTHVSASHLAGLGSVGGVLDEETDVVRALRPGGVAVVNGDIPGLVATVRAKLANRPDVEICVYGTAEGCDVRLTSRACQWDGSQGQLATPAGPMSLRLGVPGPHNLHNAIAAVAVGLQQGIGRPAIETALAAVSLPEMRLAARRLGGGVTLLNDAYNANPGSMAAALEVLALAPANCRRVLCAGDMLELGAATDAWHEQLGRQVARAGVQMLVTVGEKTGGVTAQAAIGAGLSPECVRRYPNSQAAAAEVSRWLCPGDFVLVKGSRGLRMEHLAEAMAANGAA